MDATLGLPILVGLIAVALLFDFLNGLHDAANSIATIVSTRVLRPQYAVLWAAFFNFIAFLFFGLHVANTIGTGIIEPSVIDAQVIFGALIGAIVWNVITWGLGIPSSSSHALIGGLVGAGMAKAGFSAAVWTGLSKTLLAIVLSPLVGFLLALVLVAIVSWASVRSTPFAVDRAFRILQFVSASLYSLGHGGNDAQKTMGIIAVLLYSQGHLGTEFSVPFWVVISCQAAMALGTLMGGWRIVRTMGLRITKLTPMQGFCAETGGAATLFMATWLGVPVSTTHTITGAIVGVGAARRVSAVRWNVASSIVYAWVITIPASAIIAALTYWAVNLIPLRQIAVRSPASVRRSRRRSGRCRRSARRRRDRRTARCRGSRCRPRQFRSTPHRRFPSAASSAPEPSIPMLAVMQSSVSTEGTSRVKPSVYLRPTAQPTSSKPAINSSSHAMGRPPGQQGRPCA